MVCCTDRKYFEPLQASKQRRLRSIPIDKTTRRKCFNAPRPILYVVAAIGAKPGNVILLHNARRQTEVFASRLHRKCLLLHRDGYARFAAISISNSDRASRRYFALEDVSSSILPPLARHLLK